MNQTMKRRQTLCMKRLAFVKLAGTESRGNSKASVRSTGCLNAKRDVLNTY